MYARIPVGLLKKLLTEDNQQDKQYAVCLSYVQLLKNSLGGCAYHASRRRNWKQKWFGKHHV